ncbi:hypothetical protein K466DRAFT_489487 [Polyporus arcularius HHB13444]|uniref:Protein kinase domain-containing protein n=1 Tax=Polyporus arcularius HHB13444 TaxID=1314778 RepID=A0A5C3PEL2_9APHY|nr:hypothetical protein K466DRAFT_489487 [Polyporus arcularius HHB13444]
MLRKEGAEPRIAHLWWDLDDPDRMQGTHGYVRRAAFTRQETVSGGQLATATEQVLAKHAGWSCEGHRMLQNEAMLYSMFPRELMDTASPGGHPPVVPKFYGFYVPGPPAVPKFYGYYLPVPGHPDIHRAMLLHNRRCANSEEDACDIWSPTPILLVEECGRALGEAECARTSLEHQRQCASMLKRFHRAGCFHQTIYGRNILVQPGPLDLPPEKRSATTPSFRMIDLGRTVAVDVARPADAKMVQDWSGRSLHSCRTCGRHREATSCTLPQPIVLVGGLRRFGGVTSTTA